MQNTPKTVLKYYKPSVSEGKEVQKKKEKKPGPEESPGSAELQPGREEDRNTNSVTVEQDGECTVEMR